MIHLQSKLSALFFYRRYLILHLRIVILLFLAATRRAMMMLALRLLAGGGSPSGVHDHFHLGGNVSNGFSEVLRIVEEGARGQCLDPILVPQRLQDL